MRRALLLFGLAACSGHATPTTTSTPVAATPEPVAKPPEPAVVEPEHLKLDTQVVAQPSPSGSSVPGRLERALDVSRYRGRRVTVTARVKFVATNWMGSAVVGLDRTRGAATPGFEDRARSRRIEATDWTTATVIADVPADASALALVAEARNGTLSIEDVTIAPTGPLGGDDAPPRALEGRALDNVVAFARLYGVVRYFHPSDEVAAMDAVAWERFVHDGIARVESAPDASALAATLREVFAPIAPSMEIVVGATPAAGAVVDAPPGGARLAWDHHGVGISKSSLYSSVRVGAGPLKSVATITNAVPVAKLRGARLRIRARVRASALGEGGDAGLWISAGSFYSEPEMQENPGDEWKLIEVEGVVPPEAAQLLIGVQVIGDAVAAVEPLVVERVDGPRPTSVKLPAWSRGTALTPSWDASPEDFTITPGGEACGGRAGCLAFAHVPFGFEAPWVGELAGGVSARVPLTLGVSDGHSLPAATAARPAPSTNPMLATDRATRLAAIVIAWNIFQHFYPYFDVVRVDWPAELRTALARAAVDDGAQAFLATLRRMVGAARDGHGYVNFNADPATARAPWTWRILDGSLVITRVAPGCACDLRPGDEVIAIDGTPTSAAIAAITPEHVKGTPQFTDYIVGEKLLSGVPASQRTLRVRRDGAEHEITATLQDPASLEDALREARPANGAEVAPGIRYVDAGNCTAEQWKPLLPELAKAKAVLIDMRGYPSDWRAGILGHFTDKRIASPQWHTPRVHRPDRENTIFQRSEWYVEPATPRLRRAVFLTDGRAVSAAETFMGIASFHRLGEIVGAPTAGTNGNVNPFELPGGYLVWWTGLKVLTQDGKQHHGVGIAPTVPAKPTVAGIAAGRDEVLERAIEVAQKKMRSR